MKTIRSTFACVLLAAYGLSGCGGSGGNTGAAQDGPTVPGAPLPPADSIYGVPGASASFAQRCAPNNSLASAALRNGSLEIEKKWIRSYLDEVYLWSMDVPNVNPAGVAFSGGDVFVALDTYFQALKSPKLTDSGSLRDRFSFTMATSDWTALSTLGESAGYGLEWSMASPVPPRQIRIAYVEPGSAAAQAGLKRGDALVSVDGVSADATDQASVKLLNEASFPTKTGRTHVFKLRRSSEELLATLTSKSVFLTPVPLHKVQTLENGKRAGYLLFSDHVIPAEAQLIHAVEDFQRQGIQELVLDLRYNGGGYLFIASELAYMIAGGEQAGTAPFEALKFNAKRTSENRATPFYDTACMLSNGVCTAHNQKLPTLNLKRLYVLTTGRTCSASESIINGLRGIGVDVVQIGDTTCGKPFGFTPKDNCGITYFPIEFSSVNAKGFGDYSDGFTPGVGPSDRFVPGCRAADDLANALGDPAEGMLAAAMTHAVSGSCPPAAAPSNERRRAMATADANALVPRRNPARDNRIWLDRRE